MHIEPQASHHVFEDVARRLGMSIEAAADSAVQLANANIVRAIQLVSTERGHDPRDYVLVPYGGAGPLHAAHIAAELGIATIVVPPNAGIISAYGLIASDFVLFETLTRRAVADARAADFVREVFAEMRERVLARAAELGWSGDLELQLTADMRFVGQAFEVPVVFTRKELARLSAAKVRERFAETHHKVYFFGGETDKPVEFVSFRLAVVAPLRDLPLLAESASGHVAKGRIEIFDERAWRTGTLMSRGALKPDTVVKGPALLEDPTSTLLVPRGWSARRDDADNTIIERS